MHYPIRINKYLSDKKICSRREADRLIEKGRVFVNGKPAQIGQKIARYDKVEIKGGEKSVKSRYKYFILNKPAGYVSHKTLKSHKDAKDLLGLGKSYAPVGRLDKDSRGLLLFTNDGRIVDRLLNPKYKHEKEYEVLVQKRIKDSDIKKLSSGVNIEGYMTKRAKVSRISDKKLRMILHEGKKHQIRRMLAALGYSTLDLLRVRIQNIKLGKLAEGDYRQIKGEELKEFLSSLGL